MCGFLYIHDKSTQIDLKKSSESLNLQLHRGPDYQGEVGINISKNKNNFFDIKNNKSHVVNQYLDRKSTRRTPVTL